MLPMSPSRVVVVLLPLLYLKVVHTYLCLHTDSGWQTVFAYDLSEAERATLSQATETQLTSSIISSASTRCLEP